MAIPSIAMIPSGYKANKVYSVLPTDGSGDLDSARTTTATRVNQNGLIEEVAIGVPRLDYTDGGCPSLLPEPSSTNLITQSESFGNAYWTKSGASVTSGFSAPSVDSPLGAFKLVEGTSNGQHKLQKANLTVSATSNTVSYFIKKAERNKVLVEFGGGGGGTAVFDLSLGAIISESGVTAKIELISSDWYRCSVTFTTTATSVYTSVYTLNDSNSNSYQGDGTSGVYIFGAQLEQNSSATSYIKTEGTTISRTADSASKSGISSLINSSQGVLYAEISALADDLTNRRITISDGTNDNRIVIGYDGTSNNIFYFVIVGGVNVAAGDGFVSDITEFSKVAIKFKENDFALWVNGVETSSDNSGVTFTSNTLNSFQFATGANNSSYFYGNCKDLRIYKTALSSSELTTLTTI